MNNWVPSKYQTRVTERVFALMTLTFWWRKIVHKHTGGGWAMKDWCVGKKTGRGWSGKAFWGGLNQDLVTGKHQSYRDFRAEGTALAIASTAHSRTEAKRPLWLEYGNWEKQNGNYWMGLSKKIAWSALFLKVTPLLKGQEWEWETSKKSFTAAQVRVNGGQSRSIDKGEK